jgi:hypothetical protein
VSVEHFLEENTFLIPLGSEKEKREKMRGKGEKEKRRRGGKENIFM